MLFDLLHQTTAEVGGCGLAPRIYRKPGYGFLQHFDGNGSRLRAQFPGIARARHTAAMATQQAGAPAAKKSALGSAIRTRVVQDAAAAEARLQFGEPSG